MMRRHSNKIYNENSTNQFKWSRNGNSANLGNYASHRSYSSLSHLIDFYSRCPDLMQSVSSVHVSVPMCVCVCVSTYDSYDR